jgi:hypothetical protein
MKKESARNVREFLYAWLDSSELEIQNRSNEGGSSSGTSNSSPLLSATRYLKSSLKRARRGSAVDKLWSALAICLSDPWMAGKLFDPSRYPGAGRQVAKRLAQRPRRRQDSAFWEAVHRLDDPRLTPGQVLLRYERKHGEVKNQASFKRYLSQKRIKWALPDWVIGKVRLPRKKNMLIVKDPPYR